MDYATMVDLYNKGELLPCHCDDTEALIRFIKHMRGLSESQMRRIICWVCTQGPPPCAKKDDGPKQSDCAQAVYKKVCEPEFRGNLDLAKLALDAIEVADLEPASQRVLIALGAAVDTIGFACDRHDYSGPAIRALCAIYRSIVKDTSVGRFIKEHLGDTIATWFTGTWVSDLEACCSDNKYTAVGSGDPNLPEWMATLDSN